MIKKRIISSVIILIFTFALGFFLIKGKIAGDIQLEVIRNTSGVNDKEIIERELNHLDRAIKLNPRKYLFYATRADLNCRLGNYNEAINDFNLIFKFKPDYAEGYMFQGMIYDWIDNQNLAIDCYQKSQKLYHYRISNETDKDNIASHMINLISLKKLQNIPISEADKQLPNDVQDFWSVILDEICSKTRYELLNEMFDK